MLPYLLPAQYNNGTNGPSAISCHIAFCPISLFYEKRSIARYVRKWSDNESSSIIAYAVLDCKIHFYLMFFG